MGRHHRRSLVSAAIAALICTGMGVRPAIAQSVSGIGDVNPGPVQTPDWVVGGEIYVGDTGGTGTLTILGGGTASSDSGVIGYPGGSGTVTVSGSDSSGNASRWTMTSDLTVGWGGTASLFVLDGGRVSDWHGHVGRDGGTANAVVSGVDSHGNASTWTSSLDLAVGYAGTGTLLIESGGMVRSSGGSIGGSTGLAPGLSSGTVTVSGSDGNGHVSTWDNSSNLYVGFSDPGTLIVKDGGAVRSGTGMVGYALGGNGTVSVAGRDTDGRASSWTIGTELIVGVAATGAVSIDDGAIVRAMHTRLASDPGSSGTLHLNGNASGRGVLETGGVSQGSGTALLDLNGGILRATRDSLDFLSGFGTLSGGSEGVWMDTNAHDVGIGTAFTGAADFHKLGAGALTMSGANTYTGATIIAAGVLRAGAAGTFSAGSAHAVAAGAMLDLAGHAQTVASVNNSGTVSLPGSAAATRTTLTVTGPWLGQAGSTLQVGLAHSGGAIVSDRLVLDGTAAVASGRTSVQVGNMALLLGMRTTGDGIEVITARNGATTTAQTTRDAFGLAGGHIDAGAFEYRLHPADASGAGENWYLRSDAPMAEPAAPVAAAPAYRPEVSQFAALPEQLRLGNLVMLGNLHQRIGDEAGSGVRRQGWARLISADRTVSQRGAVNPRSEGRLDGFQSGTDLWAAAAWRVGVYVGQLDGDMAVRGFASGIANLAVGANDLRSQYLGAYATYRGPEGFYADAVLQAGRHRFDVVPSAAPRSHGKGDSRLASVELGRGFAVAANWVLEPQLQLVHQALDLDDARIARADVRQDTRDGWIVRAGLRVKGEARTGAGTLQPYGRANVYRSTQGTDVTRFIGPGGFADVATGTGGTRTELAAGATLVLSARTSVYGEIGKLWASRGDARQSSELSGALGIKVRW